MAIRSFYADIFEITVPAELELQLKSENERILRRRRAVSGILQSPQATSGSACAGSRRGNRARTE